MTIRAPFRFYSHPGEQRLHQALVTESIQIIGMDVLYLPARLNNYDKLYETDDLINYDTAYTIEMYLETFSGFSGDQSFMSKFGLEIRDQVFWTVSYERFQEEVGIPEGFTRPREKDLIYFPLNNKCFQIFYVDNKPSFYPLGQLPMYRLTTELFEYSNERFTTGIPAIDSLQLTSTNVYDHCYTDNDNIPFTDEDYNVLMIDDYANTNTDPLADNDEVEVETDTFVDFSETNPFGNLEQ